LFLICGQLVGHYPVVGWLRVACSYVKRCSTVARWEDNIGDLAHDIFNNILALVDENDPVGGVWNLDGKHGKVWCDASSLALACVFEIDVCTVEEAAWLRKRDYGGHINMAELNAVVKGVSLAAKWGLHQVEIVTDSATVVGWLHAVLFDSHKVKSHGISEMLVKRRLAVVKEICNEYSMEVKVTQVASSKNKADSLT
jgi:hypothetical protein